VDWLESATVSFAIQHGWETSRWKALRANSSGTRAASNFARSVKSAGASFYTIADVLAISTHLAQ